ncbi:regulatory protein RecX [Sphingomonas japonica]|uniref:Regulatory protein n=1 Tax=Sphingomonas japonica TaxID=511662 RepID=A0ABX0U439_9SPHN|nr:regulatory protein RecX [Sphingomonas japonica]NIJ24426.1 regulatory protein [Sphingomonas japonica]
MTMARADRHDRPRTPPPPLDRERLDRLALRYVERYATTRGRLVQYLTRKLRERGWEGDTGPDLQALADRFAQLGYIDDRLYGEAKATAMARRGLGKRRIADTLRHAGLDVEDRDALAPDIAQREEESAMTFARRKRIGPFAMTAPDRAQAQKQIAAMLRAGHSFDTARRIVAMVPGQDSIEG